LFSTQPNSLVKFGIFEADLHAGELRRSGARVRLQSQPFQVLRLLLEHPGRLITREELRSRLWPADTFVDFDHGLNAAIKRLRDALGDSAENPRFVETLARRGYRFLAPVNVPPLEAPVPSPSSAPRVHRRWPFALATAALLIAGISAGWHAGHRAAAAMSFMERPLTANPEDDPIVSAALSPDAKYVLFADRDGLFLRLVATGETHPFALPEALHSRHVAWFPDGGHVLLTSTSFSSEQPSLWSASVFGGTPVQLADNAAHADVSSDGGKILFLRGEHGREKGGDISAGEVWQMQSDGQQAQKLFGEPGDKFESAVWSPDSRQVAFVRMRYMHGWAEPEASLGIFDTVTQNTRYVLTSPRLRGSLLWTPDSRLIYSLSELSPNQNDSNLWAMRVDARGNPTGGSPVRLTWGPDAKVAVGASKDSNALLFLRGAGAPEVFVSEVQASGSALGPARRLSLDERSNIPYSWTADGKSVIFTSDRDGAPHIFKQSVDQPAPDLLVGGNQNITGGRVSPNGSDLLFTVDPSPADSDRRSKVFRMPLSGGTPRLLLSELGITGIQCARAPSNRCILSKSLSAGIAFLMFDPVSGVEKEFTRVEDQEWYLYNYSFSPDGSLLAIVKKRHALEPTTIRILPINGGTERTITLHQWSSLTYTDFAADGRSLWVRAFDPAGTETLLNINLNGEVRPVFQQRDLELGWAIPSPDGRHLAMWQASRNSNAWLLEPSRGNSN